MSEYRYGKGTTWDGYEYFYIDKKTFFGWKEQKTWGLSYFGEHSKEEEIKQKELMMESVDRLIKAGHTVL